MMRHLLEDESAATAVEYGIIAALIAAAVTLAVLVLGTKTQSLYRSVDDSFPSR